MSDSDYEGPSERELDAWRIHPVTEFVFKEVKDALAGLTTSSVRQDNADQTGLEAMYREGFEDGVKAFVDEFLNAKEEVSNDES